MDEHEYINIKKAASFLTKQYGTHVHIATIYRWISNGLLDGAGHRHFLHTTKVGRERLVKKPDLLAFINKTSEIPAKLLTPAPRITRQKIKPRQITKINDRGELQRLTN